MNSCFRVLTVAVSLALLSAQGHAQGIPDDLRQVAKKAVSSNPEVQARWRAFLAAQAERDALAGGYRPVVDAQVAVGYERILSSPNNPPGGYNANNASITLMQMLYDGGVLDSQVRRAGLTKLVRYYELLDIAEDMTLEATRVYADVLRYRELVALAKDNFVLHKQTSMQIEERTKAGVGRLVDLEQAIGRLALAESNLLTETANLHDVTARYLRLIGEQPPARMRDIPESLKFSGMPTSLKQALESAYLNNPAMNAAIENVAALRERVEAIRLLKKPTLDLRLSHQIDRNLSGIAGNYHNTSAQILFNMPLYQGGSDDALLRQVAQDVNVGVDEREKMCRDIRQAVMVSYNDTQKLTQQLDFLDQHRLSTEKNLIAYRQQFDIGQRTLLDLLDNQNEYFEASRAYVNARYDLVNAKSRTMAGVGGLRQSMAVEREGMPTEQDVGQTRARDLSGICGVSDADLKLTVVSVDKDKLMADAPAAVRRPAAVQGVPIPADRLSAAAAPAPAPAPVPKRVTFSADALFDFDKAELKFDAKRTLIDFAQKVKDSKQFREMLIAVGHTDSVGSESYNMALSLARARSVKAYLVQLGLNAALIRTEGRGEKEPVGDNATEEGRRLNRRVEISFEN